MKTCRNCFFSKWLGNQLYCTYQTTFLIKREFIDQYKDHICSKHKYKEGLEKLEYKLLEINSINHIFMNFNGKDFKTFGNLIAIRYGKNYDKETVVDLSESINNYLKERDKVLK